MNVVAVLSLVAVSVAGLAVCLTVICVGLLCLRCLNIISRPIYDYISFTSMMA